MNPLKSARNRMKITQAKLSELSGVPLRTIQDIEAGADMRFSTACKLADALGVPLATFQDDQTEIIEPKIESQNQPVPSKWPLVLLLALAFIVMFRLLNISVEIKIKP